MQEIKSTKTPTRLCYVLLVSLLLSGSCGIVDGVTKVSGVVTDSLTGQPIDSAIVQFNDTIGTEQFYSDTLGEYTAVLIGEGTIRVFCRKTGYQTKSTTIQSTNDIPTITGVDFQLVK